MCMNRDEVILGVLKKIAGGFRQPGSKDVWDTGWGEILDAIQKDGFTPEALKPQYFGNDNMHRSNGDWHVMDHAWQMDQSIRKSAISELVGGNIVELGCGTGINQLLIAEMYPDAELVAADWAKASQEIISSISTYIGRHIKPVNFNMASLEGWDDLGIGETTAVLTIHALEQLGSDWGLLLTALRAAKPRICVHVEPILELYDETDLFDYLAAEYHRARDYLSGWLPAIRELERQGKAEIIRLERNKFGNRYHEAYTILVWKPL